MFKHETKPSGVLHEIFLKGVQKRTGVKKDPCCNFYTVYIGGWRANKDVSDVLLTREMYE